MLKCQFTDARMRLENVVYFIGENLNEETENDIEKVQLKNKEKNETRRLGENNTCEQT